MTDETIKDLFYGNLNLFDRPMHRNEEYNTALQVAAEARDALEATMTDEQKKLLDAYVDKHSTVDQSTDVLENIKYLLELIAKLSPTDEGGDASDS